MNRRESEPPADASGGGGKPASRATNVGCKIDQRAGSSQQLKDMQGAEDRRIDSDLTATGSSTQSQASHDKEDMPPTFLYHHEGESRNMKDKVINGGGSGCSPATSVPRSHDSRCFQSATDFDYDTTSLDSTPRGTDGEMGSRASYSSASPYNSSEVGVCVEEHGKRSGGGGSSSSSSSSATSCSRSSFEGPESETVLKKPSAGLSSSVPSSSDLPRVVAAPAAPVPSINSKPGASIGHGSATRSVPGISARPGGVPFGASALRKTLSQDGRPRPRGLRPRSSTGSANYRSGSSNRSNDAGKRGETVTNGGAAGGDAQDLERPAAEAAAPGVAFDVVVRSAIKIESVMRVLIARGYVRRKLVSEVTAFSLIMERGIEVIKHAFSGKSKPKVVTVNFVSRKGTMQLSWGGKSGVPLETIFGVTKGIKTEALRRVVEPERAPNCFSLLTPGRTIDFEVDNPWLVLLVVRALRLFLGAHYDTLPAPTFFSHLCLRPRGVSRPVTPKQTLVWTGPTKKPYVAAGNGQGSTSTERTPGGSTSGDSGASALTSWCEGDTDRASDNKGDGDELSSVGVHEKDANVVTVDATARDEATAGGGIVGEQGGDGEALGGMEGAPELNRSPGGVMALFSSGGRRSSMDDFTGSVGGGSSESGTAMEEASPRVVIEGRRGGEGKVEEKPLTASELLATRGITKRMNLSKKLSATTATTGPLKGRRFDRMALPMDQTGQQERRERGFPEDAEFMPKRTQGMSISIGAGYDLPEEQKRRTEPGSASEADRSAVVDDLNDKLQSLRRLQLPQPRMGGFRPGKPAKTMALKHMPFFQRAGGVPVAGSGMGSIADMWGDGVRRQHQTDLVRQQDQSLEDVRKRDDARTAMLVTRSGVHKVTRKGSAPELF